MTDISVTAADVKLVTGTTVSLMAGVAITAGQVGYKEAATSKAKLSDNNSATAEVRSVLGITLNGAAADQPVLLAQNGSVVDFGAVFTAGTDYYLSGTPGGICPRADVTTGDDPVRVGMALTTSQLQLDINDPGVSL
ncbi:MAG: hypothetical protein ACOH2N_00040 [Devosia sp.]